MKTFKQFCSEACQLNEFQLRNPLNNPLVKGITSKVKPVVRNLERIESGVTASGIDKTRPQDIPTRLANLYGVIKPLSLPSMAPDIIRQGQTGSLTDVAARKIPGMTPNPKTDIGRRLGQSISSAVSRVVTPPTASGKVAVKGANGKTYYMEK